MNDAQQLSHGSCRSRCLVMYSTKARLPIHKTSSIASCGRAVQQQQQQQQSGTLLQQQQAAAIQSSISSPGVHCQAIGLHNDNSSSTWLSRLNWELLLLVASTPVPAALAEEGLSYDASKGEGIVKTLSGVLYIGLLLYFLFRVLNRRARKAREEVR